MSDPQVGQHATVAVLAGEVRDLNAKVDTSLRVIDRTVELVVSRKQRGLRHAVSALGVLYVVDILLIAGAITYGLREASRAECYAEKFDSLTASSSQARMARNAESQRFVAKLDQEITLFQTVLSPTSTAEAKRAALQSHLATVNALRTATVAANQSRVDNPLPTGTCP